MSPTSVAQFLASLDESNLVSSERMDELRSTSTNNEDATALAEELVSSGSLTRWQADMLLAGRSAFFLGRYKLVSQLGQGGMGAVFKAEQMPLGRHVAVKVMAPHLIQSESALARFRREIHAVAALNHPNIVAALDADSAGDDHFLVMEYVESQDLARVLKRRKRLPIGEACEYIRQAASGLQHAHEQGMIHRDIKPSNLLLTFKQSTDEPVVKVVDLGLARFAGEAGADDLTNTGQIMGTPDYIAPEQARDSKDADIRSDVYSLGASLYHLLTGQSPFPGGSAVQKITARLTQDPPRLRTLRPDAPQELDDVVDRMLRRDPQDRIQLPGEVANLLVQFAVIDAATVTREWASIEQQEALAQLQDVQSRAVPEADQAALDAFLLRLSHAAETDVDPYRSTIRMQGGEANESETFISAEPSTVPASHQLLNELKTRRRSDRWRLLLTSSIVLLVVALLAGYVLWQRSNRTTLIVDWPSEERVKARMEIDGVELKVPAKGPLSFVSADLQRSVKLQRTGFEPVELDWSLSPGEKKEFRPQWIPTAETLRQRQLAGFREAIRQLSEEHKHRVPDDFRHVMALQHELDEYRDAHPSDGQVIADLRKTMPAPADRLSRDSIPASELVAAGFGDPARAPAELVAVIGDSRMKHWTYISDVTISPDRKWVASSSSNHVVIWDAETGLPVQWIKVRHGMAQLAFSPDGRFLAGNGISSGSPGSLVIWETTDWSEVRRWTTQLHPSGLCYTPDGQLLITASADPADHSIVIWDPATGDRVRVLTGHSDRVNSIALDPVGQRLASASTDGSIRIWDVTSGEELRAIEVEGCHFAQIAFSPDGQRLASSSDFPERKVQFWDVETASEIGRVEKGTKVLSYHPLTQKLMVSLTTPLNALDRLGDEQQEVISQQVAHYWPEKVSFSEDGSLLAYHGYLNAGHAKVLRLSTWDTANWKRAVPDPEPITALTMHPDGDRIILGRPDGIVLKYDLADAGQVQEITQEAAAVTALAYSSDGSLLAVGLDREVYNAAGQVSIRSGDDFRLVRSVLGGVHGQDVLDVAFGANNLLASCLRDAAANRRGNLYLTEVASGRVLLAPDELTPLHVLVHPTERILYATGYAVVAMRTENGDPLFTIEENFQGIDLSPDGELLALSRSGTKIVDARTGRVSRTARGVERVFGTGGHFHADFSPDGRLVAVSTNTGTVEIWELERCDCIRTIQLGPPSGWVFDVRFTPDGRHLVTLNGNGTVYVLRLQPWPAGEKQE